MTGERERRVEVTFGFDLFGTTEHARFSVARIRRLLSIELARPVDLLHVELDDDADREGAAATDEPAGPGEHTGAGGPPGGPGAPDGSDRGELERDGGTSA